MKHEITSLNATFQCEQTSELIHCCLHAGLPSIKDCVMNPSAQLEKVLFYLPLRLIDPLFKLKRSRVDPCVDCRRWVHISAFGRQPRILITFWLQVCASLRKRKVEKTLSGLTFQCPKHFCRLHILYRHC